APSPPGPEGTQAPRPVPGGPAPRLGRGLPCSFSLLPCARTSGHPGLCGEGPPVRFDLRLATAAALLLWLPAPLSAGEPQRTGVVFVVGGIGGGGPLRGFRPGGPSRGPAAQQV